MSLTFGDNISYQGKKPLDSRSIFKTIADMKAYSENYLPPLAICQNEEDGKTYTYNVNNEVDENLGKWREFTSGGGGGTITIDTEMSDASENTVQNKVIKKYVDNNLTDVQTELTNIKKELGDGMTLVADAITAKGVETATDATLEVMAANIGAIKVGDDTSDATATESDIMLGKTAWANGVKLVGTASSSELHGATISVSSENAELAGTTVTLLKDEAIVGTRTLDESLVCSFTGIQEIGEYVVSISDGNLTSEENVTITGDNIIKKTVISVVFKALSRLALWLEAGRITQSFSTLDEVFASEITVRQLMTIHASVDTLKEWMLDDPEIVDTFVANATAMKWMGLRDYAYDTLTAAVDGLEAKILASENWEYALKDHVPVMTSDTAPYGTSYTNSLYNSSTGAYKAFDGLLNPASSYSWVSSQSTSTRYIQYKFVNPICIKRIYISAWYDNTRLKEFKILASNDNTEWEELYVGTHKVQADVNDGASYDIPNNQYYIYYRLEGISNYSAFSYSITELQFYGRALNVSVPTMTSNTVPYGEVSASSERRPAYYAFDKTFTSNNDWITAAGVSTGNIVYKFDKAINVKLVMIYPIYYNGIGVKTFEIDASNDGVNWSDTLYSGSIEDNQSSEKLNYFTINNSEKYLYYRLKVTSSTSKDGTNNPIVRVGELQFYGVDYSEREFAEGSTMSYIYDHGVIFNDFIGGLNYVKYTNPSESFFEDTYARVGGNTILQTNDMIDFSKYNALCVKSILYNPTSASSWINTNIVYNAVVTQWSQTSNASIAAGYLTATAQDECGPTIRSFDVSSITTMGTAAMQCGGSSYTDFTEWWLE